tara:strand:+ start:2481 stop:2882 length:402 start_codon:yes stop_codon:yes gene_type:complete
LNGHTFLTVGELVLFASLIKYLLWSLTLIGNTLDKYKRSGASTRRIFDLMDNLSPIKDTPLPLPTQPIKLPIKIQKQPYNVSGIDKLFIKYALATAWFQKAAKQVFKPIQTTLAGLNRLNHPLPLFFNIPICR